MKKLCVTVLALSVLAAGSAGAQEFEQRNWGIGVIAGEPTGINMKGWLGGNRALNSGLAWSWDREGLQAHIDYLLHDFNIMRPRQGWMPLYYGLGGRVVFDDKDDDTTAGLRFPVGVSYLWADAPMDVFAEVVPVLDFNPSTEFNVNGGVGMRLYFR